MSLLKKHVSCVPWGRFGLTELTEEKKDLGQSLPWEEQCVSLAQRDGEVCREVSARRLGGGRRRELLVLEHLCVPWVTEWVDL